MDAPDTFAALLAEWPQIKEDIAFVRQMKNLEVITDGGKTAIKKSPEADNAVVDLRSFPADSEAGTAAGGSISYASVALGSTQSIATGGAGAFISWTSAPTDTGAYWSAGAPTRLTIAQTGRYMIRGAITWDTNGTGERYIYIYKNGSDVPAADQRPAVSGGNTITASQITLQLAAGDYIEISGYQNSGGNLNALTPSNVTIDRLA